MPLTDGYAGADEVIGLAYPESDRLRQSFETATGLKTPPRKLPPRADLAEAPFQLEPGAAITIRRLIASVRR